MKLMWILYDVVLFCVVRAADPDGAESCVSKEGLRTALRRDPGISHLTAGTPVLRRVRADPPQAIREPGRALRRAGCFSDGYLRYCSIRQTMADQLTPGQGVAGLVGAGAVVEVALHDAGGVQCPHGRDQWYR